MLVHVNLCWLGDGTTFGFKYTGNYRIQNLCLHTASNDNIHVNQSKNQPELWHQPPELYTDMVTTKLPLLLLRFITEMF